MLSCLVRLHRHQLCCWLHCAWRPLNCDHSYKPQNLTRQSPLAVDNRPCRMHVSVWQNRSHLARFTFIPTWWQNSTPWNFYYRLTPTAASDTDPQNELDLFGVELLCVYLPRHPFPHPIWLLWMVQCVWTKCSALLQILHTVAKCNEMPAIESCIPIVMVFWSPPQTLGFPIVVSLRYVCISSGYTIGWTFSVTTLSILQHGILMYMNAHDLRSNLCKTYEYFDHGFN